VRVLYLVSVARNFKNRRKLEKYLQESIFILYYTHQNQTNNHKTMDSMYNIQVESWI